MKDPELRGILLQELYGQRHAGGDRFIALTIPPDVDENTARNVLRQLKDGGLIEYMPVLHGLGPARITAGGAAVIEGNKPAPMAIQLRRGVDIDKMMSAVDHSDATEAEKAKARSLLQQIAESPLVLKILSMFRLGGTSG